MKYLKKYEVNFRSEFGSDLFPPRKEDELPKSVPGFEDGTIDPDDDEIYNDIDPELPKISDKQRYEEFKKITKERNFIETEDKIVINLHQLSQDYTMSIYDAHKHLSNFLRDELIGKYISDGFINIMGDNEEYQGVITKIWILFWDSETGAAAFNVQLKGLNVNTDDTMCSITITIDKVKSAANNYNL